MFYEPEVANPVAGLGALYRAPDRTVYQLQGLDESEELRGLAQEQMAAALGFGSYTGEVRQGPDGQLYEWVQSVDGLGNPIGFLKKIRKVARAVSKPVVRAAAPVVKAATDIAKGAFRLLSKPQCIPLQPVRAPIGLIARRLCPIVQQPAVRRIAPIVPYVGPMIQATDRLCNLVRECGIAGLEGGPISAKRTFGRKQFWEAVQRSGRGKAARRAVDAWKVKIYWTPRSSHYDPKTNSIKIKRTQPLGEAISDFVHEMHHAEQFMSGKSPGPEKSPDREKYIRRLVAEEIEGTVRGYEARLDAGLTTAKASTATDRFPDYLRVYRHWHADWLKKHRTDVTGAVRHGKEMGRKYVTWAIRNGALKPNPLQTYSEFYRVQWNKGTQEAR